MDMLATRSPQMRKAVGVLKELSADEATRMRYEAREKARRDLESQIEEVDKKWQSVVAENEATIAEQAAENEQLRAQIAALQAQIKSDS